MENQELIFWANFETKNTKHHRIEKITDGRKSIDIYDWLMLKIDEIEKSFKEPCIISKCGVIS